MRHDKEPALRPWEGISARVSTRRENAEGDAAPVP